MRGAVEQVDVIDIQHRSTSEVNFNDPLVGAEAVDSVPATKIELTPKSAEVKKIITKIDLWISDKDGWAVEEKVEEPSANYYQAWYTNVKPNAAVPDSEFNMNLPKDVKHIKAN